MQAYIYKYIHIFIHTHTYIYIHIYAYIYPYVYICIYCNTCINLKTRASVAKLKSIRLLKVVEINRIGVWHVVKLGIKPNLRRHEKRHLRMRNTLCEGKWSCFLFVFFWFVLRVIPINFCFRKFAHVLKMGAVEWRARSLMKRALHLGKRALNLMKRASYLTKRILNLLKRALHFVKEP